MQRYMWPTFNNQSQTDNIIIEVMLVTAAHNYIIIIIIVKQAQKAFWGGGGGGDAAGMIKPAYLAFGGGGRVMRVRTVTHICKVSRILPSVSWIELHVHCGGKLNKINNIYTIFYLLCNTKNKHTTADSAKPLVSFLQI